MIFSIKNLATYALSLRRAPKPLLVIIKQVKTIFSFTQERSNRLARFLRIINAYRHGKPVNDIISEYGCSKSTVLRYARIAGLEKRPKHFDPKVRAAVLNLYKQGMPIAQIQAQLGVSLAYISKAAKKEGINRRTFKQRKPKNEKVQ